jgi:hypothetical protein
LVEGRNVRSAMSAGPILEYSMANRSVGNEMAGNRRPACGFFRSGLN